ncbi:MAG: transglutaminase-like domain-containing protein [Gemmataceae bacterium]
MDLDATLARLAADPAAPVDVFALNLHLAADEYPDLDIPLYLSRADALADAVAPRVDAADTLDAKVAELCHFLFDERGYAGNDDEYYDPRNSYLNDVLDRRLGIPISLSVLAAAVGERCGLDVVGVALPGHFVAKATDADGEVIFDPFHGGRFLDRAACGALVEAVTGEPFAADDAALSAAPAGAVAVRMLSNLKGAYLRQADFPRAARVTERLVQLLPADFGQRRDLGVTLVHAGRPGKALDHLRAYLDAHPANEDAKDVAEMLRLASKEVARWN